MPSRRATSFGSMPSELNCGGNLLRRQQVKLSAESGADLPLDPVPTHLFERTKVKARIRVFLTALRHSMFLAVLLLVRRVATAIIIEEKKMEPVFPDSFRETSDVRVQR